ncbi:MAG: acetylglutamate kinase [Dehalococcoidales bacterium]
MHNKLSNKTIVIKLGGSLFDSKDTTIEDIISLQKKGYPIVVIHGGANLVNKWLEKQAIAPRFHNGERVTGKDELDMVTAVIGGLINKEIVAAVTARGGRAVGISCVDGALVEAKIRSKEMGYVGNPVKVNHEVLTAILGAGFVPVISPISLNSIEKNAEDPLLLNVNGDTIAGEIAASIEAEKLIFLTDVNGIRDNEGNYMPRLSFSEAKDLIDSGVARGGMIPKIKACLRALENPLAKCAIIDGNRQNALLKEIEEGATGTLIYNP